MGRNLRRALPLSQDGAGDGSSLPVRYLETTATPYAPVASSSCFTTEKAYPQSPLSSVSTGYREVLDTCYMYVALRPGSPYLERKGLLEQYEGLLGILCNLIHSLCELGCPRYIFGADLDIVSKGVK